MAPRAAPPAPRTPPVCFKTNSSYDAVGVAGLDFAVVKDQQIGRPRRLRGLIRAMGNGKSRLLVRHGDIDTLEACAPHPVDHGGEVFHPGRQRHQGAVDAVFGKPVTMQHRR
jgi:hypothetical protein